MASYNKVVLVGHLTRDPDYKQLTSGQAVCRLRIAVNRQFKNKQAGTTGQEVCFIDIDVWGMQAESCRQYLHKGSMVLVEGRLKYDTWEDQQGQTRSKHSVVADRVVFLSSSSTESAEESEEGDSASKTSPVNEGIEKTLLGKIGAIKKRNAAKQTEADVGFVDEPPFQDDLPF